MKRSGTPALTPSTFRREAAEMERDSPLGMANIRTSGKVLRNQETNSACSRCSDLTFKTGSAGATRDTRPPSLRNPREVLNRTRRMSHSLSNSRKYGSNGEVLGDLDNAKQTKAVHGASLTKTPSGRRWPVRSLISSYALPRHSSKSNPAHFEPMISVTRMSP